MSLNDLIVHSGYKPDKKRNGLNEKFVMVLDTLESLEYFTKMHGSYIGEKLCTEKLNTTLFDVPSSFACISLKELDSLLGCKSHKRNTAYDKLITVLSYIRVNKLRRAENQKYKPSDKPEFFYRQIKTIATDLALSTRLVRDCISALEELNLIVTKSMPRYQDANKKWHTNVTLFADKFDGWEQELEWGEEFLLKKRKITFNQSI